MITASHNLGPDNGIQLVDPKGEMLETAWESVATKLANCKDADIPSQLDEIVKQFYIPEGDNLVVVVVIKGFLPRPQHSLSDRNCSCRMACSGYWGGDHSPAPAQYLVRVRGGLDSRLL